MSLLKQIYIR